MDVVTLQLYALEPRQNHFGLRQIKFIIYSAWHFKSLLATDFMQVAVDFKHVLIFEKKKKTASETFILSVRKPNCDLEFIETFVTAKKLIKLIGICYSFSRSSLQ